MGKVLDILTTMIEEWNNEDVEDVDWFLSEYERRVLIACKDQGPQPRTNTPSRATTP